MFRLTSYDLWCFELRHKFCLCVTWPNQVAVGGQTSSVCVCVCGEMCPALKRLCKSSGGVFHSEGGTVSSTARRYDVINDVSASGTRRSGSLPVA
jgi:hypothetical protein